MSDPTRREGKKENRLTRPQARRVITGDLENEPQSSFDRGSIWVSVVGRRAAGALGALALRASGSWEQVVLEIQVHGAMIFATGRNHRCAGLTMVDRLSPAFWELNCSPTAMWKVPSRIREVSSRVIRRGGS